MQFIQLKVLIKIGFSTTVKCGYNIHLFRIFVRREQCFQNHFCAELHVQWLDLQRAWLACSTISRHENLFLFLLSDMDHTCLEEELQQ
jgi:hypothetical protein